MKSPFYIISFILIVLISALATYFNILLLIPLLVIGLICAYFIIKSDWFLLVSIVYVYIIDAGNGISPLPIRELLFLLLLGKLILNYFTKGYRNKYFLLFLIISVIIPIYGTAISIYRGNNISFAIDDAQGYIFLFTGLGLSSLIYFNDKLKVVLIKHFLIASGIVSLFTITLFLLGITGIYSLDETRTLLKDLNLGFAGIEVNASTRIFLRSHIYVMISLIFMICMIFYTKRSKKSTLYIYISIAIFVSAILISNTRALWLGSLMGFLIVFIFSKISIRKIVFYFLLAMFIPISFIVFSEAWAKIVDRFKSIFDFSSNVSNNIRSQQLTELLYEFSQYPVIGKGFGSTLSSGYYRNIDIPYSFELSYIELLYKLGVVGFSMFVVSILMIYIIFIRCNDDFIKKVAIISFSCFLVVSITNPYIVSSLGMFLISILFAVSQNNKETNKAIG